MKAPSSGSGRLYSQIDKSSGFSQQKIPEWSEVTAYRCRHCGDDCINRTNSRFTRTKQCRSCSAIPALEEKELVPESVVLFDLNVSVFIGEDPYYTDGIESGGD